VSGDPGPRVSKQSHILMTFHMILFRSKWLLFTSDKRTFITLYTSITY